SRFYAIRGAVRQKFPALFIILEVSHHDLREHLLVHGRIENRAQDLDSAVEVPRHHIGGRDVDRGLRMRQAVAGAEAIDAAVLEEPPHDRFYADILGHVWNARPQAADTTHHEIDRDARIRRLIEHVDDLRVDQSVVLHPDRSGLAGLG